MTPGAYRNRAYRWWMEGVEGVRVDNVPEAVESLMTLLARVADEARVAEIERSAPMPGPGLEASIRSLVEELSTHGGADWREVLVRDLMICFRSHGLREAEDAARVAELEAAKAASGIAVHESSLPTVVDLLEDEVARLKAALGKIAALGDFCEVCDPAEAEVATHETRHPLSGEPLPLCAEHAEETRALFRRAESKGCGPQPAIEEHEQDTAVTIALEALGEGHG